LVFGPIPSQLAHAYRRRKELPYGLRAGTGLVVTPNFPFTLMFLPEIYGLDVRVPIASITEVKQIDGLLGGCLRIAFADGTPCVELRLRDEAGLIGYLGRAGVADEASIEPSRKLGKSYRLIVFRIFAAIWGTGALIGAFSGLPEDYRFRRDGVEAIGVIDGFDGVAGAPKPRAILSYSVGDQRYHLFRVFGSDVEIGGTGRLFYLPTDPGQARDAAFLLFDLGALGLGLLAVTASIFGGRIARRLG
jgi:hypothetical protein